MPFTAGRKVLDVACGEGYGSDLLAQVASEVVGVDVDPVTIATAGKRYGRDGLRFEAASATSLPFGDAAFDLVVSFETLEHLEDHQAFWREIKRVLNPNGTLIISTPNSELYRREDSEPNPFHVRELSESEFREVLARNFACVDVYRQNIVFGSALLPDKVSVSLGTEMEVLSVDPVTGALSRAAARDTISSYLIGVASDQPLGSLAPSLYRGDYPLSAMSALIGGLNQRDEIIRQLRQEMEETNRKKAAFEGGLAERDEIIARLRDDIHYNERKLEALKKTISDRDNRVAVRILETK